MGVYTGFIFLGEARIKDRTYHESFFSYENGQTVAVLSCVPRPKHPEFGNLGTSHPASGLVLQRDQERAGQGLTKRDDHEDGNIWV